MIDFKTTPIRTILERYVIVTLYYSLNGPNWGDQRGFLSEDSVCIWEGIDCDSMVVAMSWYRFNIGTGLNGQLPTELGLLTGLQQIELRKFATVSSSELDTIILLGSISQLISSTVVVGSNNLTGPLPSELGRLTTLQTLLLCKFATASSSDLDTIALLGSLSHN
jgi:hypothetical protein